MKVADAMPEPSRVHDLSERIDRDLIERTVNGDEEAFSTLFRGYGPAAFALSLRVIGDRTLAEEVVQEVFLSVWRRARMYEPGRGSVRSWLLTQIHHRSVDVVRREEAERRRTTTPTPAAPTDPSPDDVVEAHWLSSRRDRVREALGVLSPDQREVIELAYFEGLTQAQVASRLDTPLGTVKSRTLTAMKKLRSVLVENT